MRVVASSLLLAAAGCFEVGVRATREVPPIPPPLPGAVAVIEDFRAQPGCGDEVVARFRDRRGRADRSPGFLGIHLLRDPADPEKFTMVTFWAGPEAQKSFAERCGPKLPHGDLPADLADGPIAARVLAVAAR
ncbi:MAG: antibiotic biosynthesis monooxygenase [Planctomycetales bacterium]|nr:antibiotic biosynthesis monooxygenase [Planctomycetales bacterium]